MPNQKINYLEIIKKSIGITWRNKKLWWLGFFILLAESFGSFFQYHPRGDRIEGWKILEFTSANRELAIILALAFLFIWVILLVLGIIAKGGIIKSIDGAIRKRNVTFRNGIREGKKYFWQVFFIKALSIVFIFAALVVFMIPIGFLFYNRAYFVGGFLSLLALVIFLPLVFLVTFVKIYGYFYAVLSDLSLGESLENAYSLFRKNIVPSIIISLIFLGLGTAATILAFMLLVPVIALFFAMGALLFFLAKEIGLIITLVTSLIVIVPVLIFGGSVYQVFAHSVLLLFFREIAAPKEEEDAPVEKVRDIAPAPAPDPVA